MSKTKARRGYFRSRGSIARPRHWLSTLRSGCHQPPRKTRFRLPARLYRVGLVTHKAPTKGFRLKSVTSLPPFPDFLGARTCRIFSGESICLLRRGFDEEYTRA